MTARDGKGRFTIQGGQVVKELRLGENETIEGLSINDEMRLQAGLPIELDDGAPPETEDADSGGGFGGGPGGGFTGGGFAPQEPSFTEKLRNAVAAARGEA